MSIITVINIFAGVIALLIFGVFCFSWYVAEEARKEMDRTFEWLRKIEKEDRLRARQEGRGTEQ
jgi:hypothetical protein